MSSMRGEVMIRMTSGSTRMPLPTGSSVTAAEIEPDGVRRHRRRFRDIGHRGQVLDVGGKKILEYDIVFAFVIHRRPTGAR